MQKVTGDILERVIIGRQYVFTFSCKCQQQATPVFKNISFVIQICNERKNRIFLHQKQRAFGWYTNINSACEREYRYVMF